MVSLSGQGFWTIGRWRWLGEPKGEDLSKRDSNLARWFRSVVLSKRDSNLARWFRSVARVSGLLVDGDGSENQKVRPVEA
jgi:hypothetical protein